MSTQRVAFDNPFNPAETLTGERVGRTFRGGDPYPLARVRVAESTLLVPESDLR